MKKRYFLVHSFREGKKIIYFPPYRRGRSYWTNDADVGEAHWTLKEMRILDGKELSRTAARKIIRHLP